MTHIKNIHLLTDIVTPADIKKMEHAAQLHKRYSNITFKVIEVTDKKVVFRVEQGRSSAGNYQSGKRLIEIVHETFARFFPDHRINAGPVPYRQPGPDQVTPEWIVKKMKATGTRLKAIADDTGLNYSYLSAITNGHEQLSQVTKAVFWYYFKTMELK